jgi:mannose-6-phosphate isomerase-like protein (cupin superfamily)
MKTRIDINEIEPTPTSHGVGSKRVILNGSDTNSHNTQIAFGEFRPGEEVEKHVHEDMEEYYFFIDGDGFMEIDGMEYPVAKDVFIFVKEKQQHRLVNNGDSILKFFYWGSLIKS